MADVTALKEEGRNFNCLECPERIQKLRRCREEREDFTEVDNPSVFPMYVNRGGELYGFCPAKATWDPELASTFRLLMIVAETGVMLKPGGLYDQPDWLIEALGWFLPKYQVTKLSMIGNLFLGKPKKSAPKNVGPTTTPRKGALPRGNHNR